MARADRKRMGVGARGKGSGSGATTMIQKDMIEENMVLSNRDKKQYPEERGYDSKEVQTEQYQDHPANRLRNNRNKSNQNQGK